MSDISVKIEGTTGVLVLAGRFTSESLRGFKEVAYPLVENPSLKTLCIDLAAVSFLDSSSLGILLLLREKVSAKGMNMTLRNPNPTVLPALKMVRFDKLFETSNR